MQRVCSIFHQTALRLCSAPEVLSWQPLYALAPGDACSLPQRSNGLYANAMQRECFAVQSLVPVRVGQQT